MQRRLRVCCELPPRHSFGEASSTSTLAPASRAISAAHSAALPPPTTSTSIMGTNSTASLADSCARCHVGVRFVRQYGDLSLPVVQFLRDFGPALKAGPFLCGVLLELGARFLHHLGPLVVLGADEGAELLRRHGADLGAR